ncbi:MAG: class I SAM-dependent methyltransferase [Syntrophaceae bacterium]|nr:class I SAM-dependent methyltransferase [Syntrophaceae bacterium]
MGKFEKTWALRKTPSGALHKTLDEVRQRAARPTDICDHLEELFLLCLDKELRLIVELGVGDGESSFVFERAAKLWDAVLVSVDIEDRANVSTYGKRHFLHGDDVAFGDDFPSWCAGRGLSPEIDLLFIDTSHLYEHTVQEIRAWFPHLGAASRVVFHDTNMKESFVRRDGSIGAGWDNARGVIRAVEEYVGQSFPEETDFTRIIPSGQSEPGGAGWLVRHRASCNGLTILDRL